MKKIGEYLIYRKEVCKVSDIKENNFTQKMCYTLIPESDKSLKMTVPVDNEHIRDLMTREEINELLSKIRQIPVIEMEDKLLEAEYKRLLNEEKIEDIIKIIKTTYLRNQNRINNNKKISDKDNRYFELAENYLYQEIATVFEISLEEAKEFVIESVK